MNSGQMTSTMSASTKRFANRSACTSGRRRDDGCRRPGAAAAGRRRASRGSRARRSPPSAQRAKSRIDASRYSASCGNSGASVADRLDDRLDAGARRGVVGPASGTDPSFAWSACSAVAAAFSASHAAGSRRRCTEPACASSTTSGSPTMAWIAPGLVWLMDMGTSDPSAWEGGECADATGKLPAALIHDRKSSGVCGRHADTSEHAPRPMPPSRVAPDVASTIRSTRRSSSRSRVDARATLAQISQAVGLSVSAVQTRLRRLETRGVILGYRALLDPEAVGKSLSAFIEITPLDPSQPDNAPELLEHLAEIEACHSIAGDASYILFVRVATPRDLEALIRDIRLAASVSTRTTVVLQTFYENRPIAPPTTTPSAAAEGGTLKHMGTRICGLQPLATVARRAHRPELPVREVRAPCGSAAVFRRAASRRRRHELPTARRSTTPWRRMARHDPPAVLGVFGGDGIGVAHGARRTAAWAAAARAAGRHVQPLRRLDRPGRDRGRARRLRGRIGDARDGGRGIGRRREPVTCSPPSRSGPTRLSSRSVSTA